MLNRNRIETLVAMNLTGYAVKNSQELLELLEKLHISVDLTSKNSKYFLFYSDVTEDSDFGEQMNFALPLTTEDVSNGFWKNSFRQYNIKKMLTLDEFKSLTLPNLRYYPYGFHLGSDEIENWKPLSLNDFYLPNLNELYFEWRIQKELDPQKKDRLITLKDRYLNSN